MIQSTPQPLAGVSILVVDNDLDGRELLHAFLTHVGAAVRTAASALEGLALFKSAPPAVVVTDAGMPDYDGVWLLRQIRSLAAIPAVPVVAITGRAMAHEQEMLREAGFDAQAVKPFDLDAVVDVITAAIRR
jgi:CheY-like chemotaxis protein